MKKNLLISVLMTIVTTVLLGLVYPLVVTGLAQVSSRRRLTDNSCGATERLSVRALSPSLLWDQAIFIRVRQRQERMVMMPAILPVHNLGPTNQKLIDRVNTDVASAQAENPGKPVPSIMVTTSASGFDPHITPASAEFQVPRIAKARGMSEEAVRALVARNTQGRQWGFFGEPRVNVLELNLGAGFNGKVGCISAIARREYAPATRRILRKTRDDAVQILRWHNHGQIARAVSCVVVSPDESFSPRAVA